MTIKVEYDPQDRYDYFARLYFWVQLIRKTRMQKANCEAIAKGEVEINAGTWGW